MAGGRWWVSYPSPVVSRLLSGSSPDRGVARPCTGLTVSSLVDVGTERRRRTSCVSRTLESGPVIEGHCWWRRTRRRPEARGE